MKILDTKNLVTQFSKSFLEFYAKLHKKEQTLIKEAFAKKTGKVPAPKADLVPENLTRWATASIEELLTKNSKPHAIETESLSGKVSDVQIKDGSLVAKIEFNGAAKTYADLMGMKADQWVHVMPSQRVLDLEGDGQVPEKPKT